MGKLFSTIATLFALMFFVLCSFPDPFEALKLNLIPPSSPKSPFYLGNLTLSERIEKLANQSRARAELRPLSNTTYSNFTSRNDETEFVLGLLQYGPLFAVEIGLGTIREEGYSMAYALLMDTTCSITWLQCEACIQQQRCFPQDEPLFPNTESRSYNPLHWSRDKYLCDPDVLEGDLCYYQQTYADKYSSSYGQLAYETMIFLSDAGELNVQGGLILGCGFNQVGFNFWGNGEPSKVAGILGLGQGPYPYALHKQLASRGGGEGIFSYCLPDIMYSGESLTFLHFGADNIIPNSSYVETPLIPVMGKQYYSLDVLGIMVNQASLAIPRSTFQINSDGSGGTVLDSGSPFSHLPLFAYYTLEDYLVRYFSDNNRNYTRQTDTVFPLCYFMQQHEGYTNLPSITFIVKGGFFEISPEQAFFVDEADLQGMNLQYFCLMMFPRYTSMTTLIGAYQQANHRFIYDTEQLKLWFKPANCALEK